MKGRRILVLVLLASAGFNVFFVAMVGFTASTSTNWPFIDLGPAVIQDSYHGRAPALESPFGMIGDMPGGYSLYSGNPLQSEIPDDLSAWIVGEIPSSSIHAAPPLDYMLLAAILAFTPLLVIAILGRRSFGSAKTQ